MNHQMMTSLVTTTVTTLTISVNDPSIIYCFYCLKFTILSLGKSLDLPFPSLRINL